MLHDITEGGEPIIAGKGAVRFINKQQNASVFEVGSGNYHFSALLSDNKR